MLLRSRLVRAGSHRLLYGGLLLTTMGMAQVPGTPSAAITLAPATLPTAAAPGVTPVNATGTGFPSGTITPAQVRVSLQPEAAGPAMVAAVSSVTTLTGTSRRVTFQVSPANPAQTVQVPTVYRVSLAGTTVEGAPFASSNTSALTINPPASIVSLAPAAGSPGQSLTVTITGAFSNFFAGSTKASFGAGISVGGAPMGSTGTVTVTSPTSVTAQIAVLATASIGPRDVTVQTGAETATLLAGFRVLGGSGLSVSAGPDQTITFPLLSAGAFKVPSDQALYGLTTDAQLALLDVRTARTFPIGTTGIPTDASGLLYGGMDFNVDGSLYAGISNTLYRIDTNSGQATLVRVISASEANVLQNMAFVKVPVAGPGGTTLAPGTLLGSSTGGLTAINIQTGSTQPIGRTGFEDDAYAMSATGILYGIDAGYPDNSSLHSALFRISTTNAASSLITSSLPSAVSLTFGPAGALYLAGSSRGLSDPTMGLWRVDPASGSSTLVGDTKDRFVELAFTTPVATTELSGIVQTNGIAASQVQTVWTKVIGPGEVTFSSPQGLNTKASFTAHGTYVLRLTATAGSETISDDITVVVATANMAPLVDAGPNSTVTLPASATLSGFVTDDGLPSGANVSVLWSKFSGPGSVTFANASSPSTTASFTAPGTYILRLTANDSLLESNADTIITVVGTSAPAITSVNPNAAQQGQAVTVTLTGQNTHFVQGMTQVRFGEGIAVNGAPVGGFGVATVTSPTTATAQLQLSGLPQWLSLTPTGSVPPMRAWHSAIYTGTTNQMIIYGGQNLPTIFGDVWRLTSANGVGAPSWTQVSPQGTSPGPRWLHTAVYDPTSDRMIVFGGCTGTPGPYHNDLWVLTNASGVRGTPSWMPLSPAGSTPSGRCALNAVYDPAANRMMIFGGQGSPTTFFNDVWVLSNANGLGGTPVWTQLSPTGSAPVGREGAAAVYDQATNRMILFGGRGVPVNPANVRNDVWVLTNANGLGGPSQWTLLSPAGGAPSTRSNAGAVYDAASNRMVIYGGHGTNFSGCQVGDVWVLDHANGNGGTPTWMQLGPFSALPGVRDGNLSMIYDPATDRMAIFSGQGSPALNNEEIFYADTWVLTAAARSTSPGVRTITVQTGTEQLTVTDGFTITPAPGDPAIGVEPVCGSQGETVTVSLLGRNTNFITGITRASFGAGIAVGGATSGTLGPLTVTSPTTATAQLAIGPAATLGLRDMVVQTASAQVVQKGAFAVRVPNSSPTLSLVTPNTGQSGQTLTVTLTGQNTHFAQGTTAVDFGAGITVGTVIVASTTSLTAQLVVSATAAPGERTVTVQTGTEQVSLPNGFSVVAPSGPAISTISPNSGPQGQGGPVTVVGLNTRFVQGTSQLSLGPGITVSAVNVTCATCLTAQLTIAPDAPLGLRTVTVTTGTEVASLPNGFTVVASSQLPILTSLNPAAGRPGQTFSATITGANTHFLQGTTQVSLGAGVVVNSVVVASPTSLTAQLAIDPNASPGTRTLTVTTNAEVVSAADVFTVQQAVPVLSSVSPNVGQQGQALSVALTGQFTHFAQGATQVNFGGDITVGAINVTSPTSLTVALTIPATAAAGTRTITVTTGAETASLAGGFRIQATTVLITGVTPTSGQQGQTLAVAITGQSTRFVQGTTQASFGPGISVGGGAAGALGPVTVADSTHATAQLVIDRAAAPGARTVTVQTGTEQAALANAFVVQAGVPSLISVTPATGQPAQTLSVTLTGQFTQFTQGTTQASFGPGISVGGAAAGALGPVTVADSTHATAQLVIAASAALGARTVTVQTGAEQLSLPAGFTVQNGAPTLVSVTPSSAGQAQTLAVTLTGQNTHFAQGTTQANFGPGILVGGATTDTAFGPVTVLDATHATAQLAIRNTAAVGPRTITVQTGAEQVTLNNGFAVTLGVNQPPTVDPGPDRSVTLPNTLTLNYTVTDDGLPAGGRLTIAWDQVSGPGTALFSNQTLTSIVVAFDKPGLYVLRLTADDTQATASKTINVTVLGGPTNPPTVSLTSPIEGAEITSPVAVTGTVNSSSLTSWSLQYRQAEDPSFHPLVTGTTPVLNGTLGTFDPSLLLNGTVYLRLSATDSANQTVTTDPISVVVSRNLKVGNFTVSFNDLTIPVAGLPIQVIRTYDSRNKMMGDFGIGWTLDLRSVRLSESVALGERWVGSRTGGLFPSYCVQPSKPHLLTATLTDGTVYEFDANVSPQCTQLAPPTVLSMTFTPHPGSATATNGATLAIIGTNQPTFAWTQGDITLFDEGGSTFDPDRYILTLPDGRVLRLSRQAGLQSLTDRTGNTLTITPNGIQHSAGKSVTFQRDAMGRILKITDPAGSTLTYGYELDDLKTFTDQESRTSTYSYDKHLLIGIQDPRGLQPIRNEYDSAGRLTKSIDAFGKTIQYNHQIGTRQEIITDRLNNITVNEYDDQGNIVQVTDAEGGVTKREYDPRGNVTKETDPLGRVRSYQYDAQDNRTREEDPLGSATTYTYNGRKQVTSIKDALGHETINTYDATTGTLTSTKDAKGQQTSYRYNGQGLVTSMTDPTGAVTTYEYNAFGYLTKQTDGLLHDTLFEYDGNGNKTKETRTRTTPAGRETLVTQYAYDKLNRLIKTTYPDNSTTQIQYNEIGKQIATIDPLNRRTSSEYDAMGRLTKTTFPDNTTEQSVYDAEGRRIRSIDRANRTTAYEYDKVGRLTATTYPDSAVVSTGYDQAGQVISTKDARGFNTQYQYDKAGHRKQVTNALNQTTTFDYDAVGNQTQMTDANGYATKYEYDELNRRTKVIYFDNTTEQTGYDALGRTTQKTDQANRATRFAYDKLGRLLQVTDALSQVTSYAYDEVGNRVSQTDAKSHTTRFEYDTTGRRTKRTLPLGMSETSVYDVAGNLKQKTDFNGRTTQYNYDLQNRLTDKIPDVRLNEPTVHFDYYPTGQRQRMTDASGVTSYQYDERDRLLQKATPQGTLSYIYDKNGNLTSIRSSNANGTAVNYDYDALSRLSTAKDNRLTVGTTSYTYDKAGNLQAYTYPNGVSSTLQYNALNRLTDLTIAKGATPLAKYSYQLGPAGNRTQVSELGGRQVAYSYDELYRLKSETITGAAIPAANGAISYTYDAVGNRLSRTSTVAAVSTANYAYDDNDHLTSDSYDTNGNTTASGGNTYAYDFENRLKSMNGGAVAVVYDGDGNRVAKTAAGVTTKYLVDDRNLTGYVQVLEELQGSTVQRVYTYGLNRISESQSSGTSFYGYDGHGSVRLLTDSTGAVTDRYDYDAFGNIISQTGTTPNVYLYSGEQVDTNLGLYYLRARYYKADGGRFATPDVYEGAINDPISLHRYLYGRGNPTNQVDPSGNASLTDAVLTEVLQNVLGSLSFGMIPFRHFNDRNAPDAVVYGVSASGTITPALLGGIVGLGSAFPFVSSTVAGQILGELQRLPGIGLGGTVGFEILASARTLQLVNFWYSGGVGAGGRGPNGLSVSLYENLVWNLPSIDDYKGIFNSVGVTIPLAVAAGVSFGSFWADNGVRGIYVGGTASIPLAAGVSGAGGGSITNYTELPPVLSGFNWVFPYLSAALPPYSSELLSKASGSH